MDLFQIKTIRAPSKAIIYMFFLFISMFLPLVGVSETINWDSDSQYILEKCDASPETPFTRVMTEAIGEDVTYLKRTSPGGEVKITYWHKVRAKDSEEYIKHFAWYSREKGHICMVYYDIAGDFVKKEKSYISAGDYIEECRRKHEGSKVVSGCVPPGFEGSTE
ncbi:MAG: hypothetical protein COA99_19595 [Moraxellaceae bacterium]|nr:MAG: hypothetical protein COA99_19595 [Moraxellaceae bacterium]